MYKILITGGSGTVGRAFIKKYYDKYIRSISTIQKYRY